MLMLKNESAPTMNAVGLSTFLSLRTGVGAEPVFEIVLEPEFDRRLIGFKIVGDPGPAISELEREFQPPAAEEALELSKRLVANTRRRQQSTQADAYMLRGLCEVIVQFPGVIARDVVGGWHRREGDDAIFTPAQAELYRALDAATRPYLILCAALNVSRETGGLNR